MRLDTSLREYGLNDRETKLYLALLENGQIGVLALSKLLKINRTGLYYTLNELTQKGLAEAIKIGKKRYWKATDPDQLLTKENEKQKLLVNLMPELRATYNSLSGKPRITYYEGIEGINRMDDDLVAYLADLPEQQRDTVEYARMEDIFSGKFSRLSQTTASRKATNTFARQIAPATAEAIKWLKGHKAERDYFRKILLVPDRGQAKNTLYVIAGNKIAYYFLDEKNHPASILIEDKAQADIQRELFNLAWQDLDRR